MQKCSRDAVRERNKTTRRLELQFILYKKAAFIHFLGKPVLYIIPDFYEMIKVVFTNSARQGLASTRAFKIKVVTYTSLLGFSLLFVVFFKPNPSLPLFGNTNEVIRYFFFLQTLDLH